MDNAEYATKRDLVELRLDMFGRFAPREDVEELEGVVQEANTAVAVIKTELVGIRESVDKLEATINKFMWALLLPLIGGIVAIIMQAAG